MRVNVSSKEKLSDPTSNRNMPQIRPPSNSRECPKGMSAINCIAGCHPGFDPFSFDAAIMAPHLGKMPLRPTAIETPWQCRPFQLSKRTSHLASSNLKNRSFHPVDSLPFYPWISIRCWTRCCVPHPIWSLKRTRPRLRKAFLPFHPFISISPTVPKQRGRTTSATVPERTAHFTASYSMQCAISTDWSHPRAHWMERRRSPVVFVGGGGTVSRL